MSSETCNDRPLPDEFDPEDIEAYLKAIPLSENNVRVTMRILRPLIAGQGVRSSAKSDVFMQGVKVTPLDNIEDIRCASRVWLPREIDTHNGYVLHAIQKLVYYKQERLQGIPVKRRPPCRRTSCEGGVADSTGGAEESDSLDGYMSGYNEDVACEAIVPPSINGKRSLPCEKDQQNLYCVQWVNILGGQVVSSPYFKIGRGNSSRAHTVHGQNPAKFPVVGVWRGVGFLEPLIHHQIRDRQLNLGGGKEWFAFEDVQNVSTHLDELILRNLRVEGDISLDSNV